MQVSDAFEHLRHEGLYYLPGGERWGHKAMEDRDVVLGKSDSRELCDENTVVHRLFIGRNQKPGKGEGLSIGANALEQVGRRRLSQMPVAWNLNGHTAVLCNNLSKACWLIERLVVGLWRA